MTSVLLDRSLPREEIDSRVDSLLRRRCVSAFEIAAVSRELTLEYPDIADQIRDSAMLTEMMWSRQEQRCSLVVGERIGPNVFDGKGRYEVLSHIGEGSHGRAYLVRDMKLREKHASVVAKIAPDRRGDAEFIEEAFLARSVNHSSICRVLDADFSADGLPFIVSELAAGGSLAELVEQDPNGLSTAEVAEMLCQLASALHALHESGLIHRDLKPDNILFRDADQTPQHAMIADFSSATTRERISSSTASMQAVGNERFMAPEVLADPLAASVHSDIYGLGAVGRSLLGERTRLPLLEAVLARACDQSPSNRYESAESLAEDLQRAARGYCPKHVQVPLATRVAAPIRRSPARTIAAVALTSATVFALAYGLEWAQRTAFEAGVAASRDSYLEARALSAGESLAKPNRFRDWLTSELAIAEIRTSDPIGQLLPSAGSERQRAELYIAEAARLEAAGQGDSADAFVMSLAGAFRAVSLREHIDGIDARLAHASTWAESRLEPTDPIFLRINVIRLAHATKQVALSGWQQTFTEEESYAAAKSWIEELGKGQDLTPPQLRDPIIALAVRCIWHVSGPRILDEPQVHGWCDRQIMLKHN